MLQSIQKYFTPISEPFNAIKDRVYGILQSDTTKRVALAALAIFTVYAIYDRNSRPISAHFPLDEAQNSTLKEVSPVNEMIQGNAEPNLLGAREQAVEEIYRQQLCDISQQQLFLAIFEDHPHPSTLALLPHYSQLSEKRKFADPGLECYLEGPLFLPDMCSLHEQCCEVAVEGKRLQLSSYTSLLNAFPPSKWSSDRHFVFALYQIARSLGKNDECRIRGKTYNRRDLCINAINIDLTFAPAWTYLGALLPINEKITIDKARYTKQECLEMALSLDPQQALAWLHLGYLLKDRSVIRIASWIDGKPKVKIDSVSYVAEQCFAKALQIDSNMTSAWLGLKNIMEEQSIDHITIKVDGIVKTYTKKECLVQLVQASPNKSQSWYDMASFIHHENNRKPVCIMIDNESKQYSYEDCVARYKALERSK